ncbi:hypothetical protein MARI151_60331 [Maribacter litoralis]|uniref:Uncharacterized protein n=1 Tax=Maribacter litoralis TaxID=2059726 RepID=A0A653WQA4_9FLAO|nr:hypothetical protein MARI151_60331 [Maribacter litoralis]
MFNRNNTTTDTIKVRFQVNIPLIEFIKLSLHGLEGTIISFQERVCFWFILNNSMNG